ncbi:hypothetical protein SUDANB135_00053 [Streptomyces sp. SudanB135_2055]
MESSSVVQGSSAPRLRLSRVASHSACRSLGSCTHNFGARPSRLLLRPAGALRSQPRRTPAITLSRRRPTRHTGDHLRHLARDGTDRHRPPRSRRQCDPRAAVAPAQGSMRCQQSRVHAIYGRRYAGLCPTHRPRSPPVQHRLSGSPACRERLPPPAELPLPHPRSPARTRWRPRSRQRTSQPRSHAPCRRPYPSPCLTTARSCPPHPLGRRHAFRRPDHSSPADIGAMAAKPRDVRRRGGGPPSNTADHPRQPSGAPTSERYHQSLSADTAPCPCGPWKHCITH